MGFRTHVLLFLRNGEANTWEDLCKAFDWDPDGFHTGHSDLLDTLEQLEANGLISYEKGDSEKYWGEKKPVGKIKVTKRLESLQRALGVSLSEVAKLSGHSMVVHPHYPPPDSTSKRHDVFVIMPFSKELQPIYDDHIKKVAQDLSLTIARADDFFTADSVMSDVWEAICNARVIIADCTDRNPNVFYEIGLAHVLGKPVIFITQSAADVPFDVRHIRYIEYQYTPRGMTEFEQTLTKTLQNTMYKDG